ncbi:GAF and ANTAR domain-containing protein [Streptomyces thermospinosisporus]|uniref:GAF and ANTAR domain-containing protein n=1 Tax=Streptomyces thermospinosisporus TaxID=161482 RepID=UPI0031D8B297
MALRSGDDPGGGPGPGRARDPGGPGYQQAAEAIAEGVRGVPPGEVPGRLCAVAVELLPVDGASVSLRSDGMPVQLCASSPHAAHLAQLQATLGDGPCRQALETGAPVLVADLAVPPYTDRWPVFVQQALAAGVRAVHVLPLGSEAVCVGTLDLYRATPGGLGEEQVRIALLVAGVMTVALMALPHGEEYDLGSGEPWLSGLAAEHDTIYQAVGMIMAQLGVGADEALARLRGDAFAYGRTALDVARDVVAHRRRFDAY